MNLDELQSVRDRERQTDKLQQLRETFYEDAGEFIQQLRDQRERAAERADDPFDAPEVNRLSDEIDTAEQTVEAIYEKRVGKIVKAASFAAADLPAESDGMTAEEQDLFETLVDDIKSNRQHVMDVLEGVTSGAPTGATASDGEPVADRESATELGGPPTESDESLAEEAGKAETGPTPPPIDEGEPGEPSTTDRAPPTEAAESGVSAADVMGNPSNTDDASAGADQKEESGTQSRQAPPETESEPKVRNDGGTATESTGVDRETVRITKDVGDFLGVDEREYDLSENDVVTLPATNVGPLVDRDAAERL